MNVFVAIDFGDLANNIHSAIEAEDMEQAHKVSESMLNIQNDISASVGSIGGKTILRTGDSMIVWTPFDKEFIEILLSSSI